MAKYENIRALAKKQLQAVTESSGRWKAFLRTAAIAYNYSFPNQLLIHEQSPTATAVADIAYWNNNAGRWVKRGAHGIAVFDTRANSSRLRYLFDISDTIPRAEIPEALPWVITDQNWRPSRTNSGSYFYSLSPKAVCIWPRCGAAWILRGWTCLPLSP